MTVQLLVIAGYLLAPLWLGLPFWFWYYVGLGLFLFGLLAVVFREPKQESPAV